MTVQDLIQEAEKLERKLQGADLSVRLKLQPEVSSILERLRAAGAEIPAHLRQLDAALSEDAVEAQFDNMPV